MLAANEFSSPLALYYQEYYSGFKVTVADEASSSLLALGLLFGFAILPLACISLKRFWPQLKRYRRFRAAPLAAMQLGTENKHSSRESLLLR